MQGVVHTYHENSQKAAQFGLGLSVVLQRLSAVAALPLAAQSVLSEPYCWVGLQQWWLAQVPERWTWSGQRVPREPPRKAGAVNLLRAVAAAAAAAVAAASVGNAAGEHASQRT